MVKVVVVGSIALDDVKTPFGSVENALGGSAVFASLACSLYSKAGIVGVVGKDFPEKHLKLLESKGISLEGLEVSRAGKTFHWKGEYGLDVNTAKTIFTELNVPLEGVGETNWIVGLVVSTMNPLVADWFELVTVSEASIDQLWFPSERVFVNI